MGDQVAIPRRAQRAQSNPRRGDERERALLAAAERMLRAGRYADASIQELSEAAGISRPTFYFYFASKQALLAHLIDQAIVELGRVTIAIGDPTVEPADQVGRAIAATADIWREHALVMCAAVELSATVPEIDRRWTATVHETAEAAVDLIVSLDVIPEARDEDAARRLVRALVWATERNFYNVMRAGGDDAELSALVHDLTVIWRRALGLVER